MEPTEDPAREQSQPPSASDFAHAARQRWERFAEELRTDVSEFNSREGGADFVLSGENQFRVSNSRSGVELVLTADFDAHIIRYDYQQMNDKTAGVPEGGMLSIRQLPNGPVEFFSADEQLTSEEAREILLEPVLFPPEMAA